MLDPNSEILRRRVSDQLEFLLAGICVKNPLGRHFLCDFHSFSSNHAMV
jgi:hypothetical protein